MVFVCFFYGTSPILMPTLLLHLCFLSSYFYVLSSLANIIVLCACEIPLESIWTPFPLLVSSCRSHEGSILHSRSRLAPLKLTYRFWKQQISLEVKFVGLQKRRKVADILLYTLIYRQKTRYTGHKNIKVFEEIN